VNIRLRLEREDERAQRSARSRPMTGVALAMNLASNRGVAHRIVGGAAGMRDVGLVTLPPAVIAA